MLRLGNGGWAVAYEPAAQVMHVQGVSADRHPYRMLLAHHVSMWRFAVRATPAGRRWALPWYCPAWPSACWSRWAAGPWLGYCPGAGRAGRARKVTCQVVMGKASSSKKVARAAGLGGSRAYGSRPPWGYYFAVFALVLLGLVGVYNSREYRDNRITRRGPGQPGVT